jgi:hypothetical protein
MATTSSDAPLAVNARALADAMILLSGDVGKGVDLAKLGTTLERYWPMNVWRAACTEAARQLDMGIKPRQVLPLNPAHLPAMRYFNHDPSDSPIAMMESRIDETPESFFMELDEVDAGWIEAKYGSFELRKVQIACIEAEIEFCGL